MSCEWIWTASVYALPCIRRSIFLLCYITEALLQPADFSCSIIGLKLQLRDSMCGCISTELNNAHTHCLHALFIHVFCLCWVCPARSTAQTRSSTDAATVSSHQGILCVCQSLSFVLNAKISNRLFQGT